MLQCPQLAVWPSSHACVEVAAILARIRKGRSRAARIVVLFHRNCFIADETIASRNSFIAIDDVRDHVAPLVVSNTKFHVDCVAGMGGGGTNGSTGMAMEAQQMFATLSPKLPPGRPIPTQILNTVQVVHNFDF